MKILRVRQPNGSIADIPIGKGIDGKDGYTPVKGVDYFDGIDGVDGKSAYKHAQDGGYLGTEEEFNTKLSTDYIDWFGVGISIPEKADLNTYKTNGKYYCTSESRAQTLLNRPDKMNTNFVMWVFSRTSSSIKSQLMLTLTGKMYIRSSSSSAWRSWVAYTTSAEIEELTTSVKEEFISELIKYGQVKPEFVNDISECTDTNQLYVLPDGYLYAYMTKEVVTKAENKLDRSKIVLNTRYSGSPGSAVTANGYYTTDFIPVNMNLADPLVMRISPASGILTPNGGAKLILFDKNKNPLKSTYIFTPGASGDSATLHEIQESGNDYICNIGYTRIGPTALTKDEVYDSIAYIRLTDETGSSSAITLDRVPEYTITFDAENTSEMVLGWHNTGHLFVPANYDKMVVIQNTTNFANDISECTDTNKLYVLPDGYIYGYIKTTEVKEHNAYDANSAEFNRRITSSGDVVERNGILLLPYEEVRYSNNYIVTIKGIDSLYQNYGVSIAISFFDINKNKIGQSYHSIDNLELPYSFDLFYGTNVQGVENAAYARIQLGIKPFNAETEVDSLISPLDCKGLVVNFEPKNTVVNDYAWASTGHAFVPADYEDRIIKLETENKEQAEKIAILESGVTNGNGTVDIPSFWENAVNECITKIKALQVGRNCVTFPFFSDNHTRNGYSGVLIAKIMKECHIPYAFYGGDSISSGYIASEADMIAQDKAFDDAMSYIPNGRFCRAVGNHDGYWAVDANNKNYYTDAQNYELFLREESVAQNKHFGGDGTYYYVDDIASKVRWVVLDTNDGIVETEQINWLRDVALSFNEKGWAVVFISHQPISNHYHAMISNFDTVIAAVEDRTGSPMDNEAEVVGWFSGHIHRDRIYTGVAVNTTDDSEGEAMPFKQVTITSDHTGIAYDDATKHPVANDDKSHAIDFVTINKSTRTVNLTRLGVGNDRSYSY